MLTATQAPVVIPVSPEPIASSTAGRPINHRFQRLSVHRLVASKPSSRLRLLMLLQQGSTPVTLVLGAALLGIYGWSVYSQRAWSDAYSRLNQLQREERQVVAANETRKFEVTEQAATASQQFVPQVPANTVFLQPEAPRSPKPAEPISPVAPQSLSPVGY